MAFSRRCVSLVTAVLHAAGQSWGWPKMLQGAPGAQPCKGQRCLALGSGIPREAGSLRAERGGRVAFAGCGLPVPRVCVLLIIVKFGKSEQLQEAGDCFPLPRAAGKLLGNLGSQALLHHTRRFGTPVWVSSRAGSPSPAAGPPPEAEDRQVAWRGRGERGPCSSLLEEAEPGHRQLGSAPRQHRLRLGRCGL